MSYFIPRSEYIENGDPSVLLELTNTYWYTKMDLKSVSNG